MVDVDLSVPKQMGGPGKPDTATPEHLFAAGYAACFGGALDFVAKQHKKDASKATVKCAVAIGPREKGGFGLAVLLDVTDPSLPQSGAPGVRRTRRTKRSAPTATPRAATSTSRWSPTGRNPSPAKARRKSGVSRRPARPPSGDAFDFDFAAERAGSRSGSK